MILYSIIPAEVVFENFDKMSDDNHQNENKLIEMEYLGEKVQVTPLSNSKFVINRLISTSPKAYLNPKLQPGTTFFKANDQMNKKC
jgi:hypothetical protein